VEPSVLLLLIGFFYIVVFGGLSLFKREGLSARFAVEAIIITVVVSALTALTGYLIQPVVFLIFVYLVTMRIRLLVDVGNFFAERGQFARADGLYALASRLWPDATGLIIIKINQATSLLKQNKLDASIAMLEDVLQQADKGYMGVKHEAAVHYNLGVAYLRKNMDARATMEFNAVLDTWPTSQYARHATVALERRRQKK